MSAQQQEQVKTPKEELHDLMVDVFGMIENIKDLPEGEYLQFAELFKRMNLNVNKLTQARNTIQLNSYYIRYIRPTTKTTLKRKRLTEAEKASKPEEYHLCNCGRYISVEPSVLQEHLQTQVHYQGRRNKKYARTCLTDDEIRVAIEREVLLQKWVIKHLEKSGGIKPDDETRDEQGK